MKYDIHTASKILMLYRNNLLIIHRHYNVHEKSDYSKRITHEMIKSIWALNAILH